MYEIIVIDIINGEKQSSILVSCRVNVNQYEQFKKDCSALYSRILKMPVTVAPGYRDLNKQKL